MVKIGDTVYLTFNLCGIQKKRHIHSRENKLEKLIKVPERERWEREKERENVLLGYIKD